MPRAPRKRTLLSLLVLLAGYAVYAVVTQGSAGAASTLLSQGKPTTASSIENGGTVAANATDGNAGTRWSSAFSDPQWLQVDLGATATIDTVMLRLGNGVRHRLPDPDLGRRRRLDDRSTRTTTGTGGTQTLTVTGSGRYVRMNGTTRATGWGYSLWEFQVFGSTGTDATARRRHADLRSTSR